MIILYKIRTVFFFSFMQQTCPNRCEETLQDAQTLIKASFFLLLFTNSPPPSSWAYYLIQE